LAILDDPTRVLISSEFVPLEVLPKAAYHKRSDEVAFYQTFFDSLSRNRLVRVSRSLVDQALKEAIDGGLSAVDALHVAAAKRRNCEELYTTERPEKPLFRATGIRILSIR
jgi:hypothetical protein